MKIERIKTKVEVPSVAMGDIAFNLIIFFVILAKAEDDRHVKWKPAVGDRVEKARTAVARVTIDEKQKVWLNGQEISIHSLKSNLEKRLEGLPAKDRRVFLKCDEAATAIVYEPVIEAISEAGAEMWHVINEKKAPP